MATSWSIGVLDRHFSRDHDANGEDADADDGDGVGDGGVTGHCTADADTFFPPTRKSMTCEAFSWVFSAPAEARLTDLYINAYEFGPKHS